MSVSEDMSKRIALMSFVCAILVVFIHAPSFAGRDGMVAQWISFRIARIAVPFFFLMSGFFLAGHIAERGWWLTALRKRVKTLVIPFYCLNLMWFPVCFGMHWIGVAYFNANHESSMDFTVLNVLKGLSIVPGVGMPFLFVLWYIRVLLFLVLISPVFAWLVKCSKIGASAMAIVLFLMGCMQAVLLSKVGELNIFCAFYFLSGMMVRHYELYEFRRRWVGVCAYC